MTKHISRFLLFFAIGLSLFLFKNCSEPTRVHLSVADTFDILSNNRMALAEEYSLLHYGKDYSIIHSPKAVILHYTVVPDLKGTLETFLPDTMASSRTNLLNNSLLNVGVHFVVDKDGTITRLLPDSIMGRHAIGFNHVSIGIENVAVDQNLLTGEQVNANVEIIAWLVQEQPSITFLFGHHEYNDVTAPHYSLMLELDSSYIMGPRHDPGSIFISKVRRQLKKKHNIVLQR